MHDAALAPKEGPLAMNISPVAASPLGFREGIGSTQLVCEPHGAPGPDAFGSLLASALKEASGVDIAASAKIEATGSGAAADLPGALISAKDADMALKLASSVRTQILDAFQELWRTSV